MPLFAVTITLEIPVVVQAEDKEHAWDVARDDLRDILDEINLKNEASFYVDREVKTQADLPAKWDDQCIPYGGDGNTRLAELLTP